MNRKAEQIAGVTFTEILVFVIIFFIALYIGAKIWGLYTSKPLEVTVNSMYLLQKHIKYFESEPETFPLQVHKKHTIRGYDSTEENRPEECIGSCLCMCSGDPANGCEKALKCIDAFDRKGEYAKISPGFYIDATEPKNYILAKDNDVFFIE